MKEIYSYEINENLAKQSDKNSDKKAVIVAFCTAIFLAIVKFSVGLTSGSIAVLSSAIDSMLDCLVSVLNFFALKKSKQNANENFNYGYTKLEAVASMFEGIFIICIGCFVAFESVTKFHANSNEINTHIGIVVMAFSSLVTLLLVLYLNRMAKQTGSMILRADALHYKTDLYTNFAVILALVVINITGFMKIDAIFGLIISGYIVFSAINLLKDSLNTLLDRALDTQIVEQIKQIISSKKQILSFHYLNTRQSTNIAFLSVHLVFDRHISLFDAHAVNDEIESEIRAKFAKFSWEITMHLDPCDDRLQECVI